ncbi:MAG: ADP-dependent glucokinase/phosphofructokinase [Candidatus Heimdallarchaeota archaeon]|nr:ADP-dependent glucokinase/phosphofructokinase [Candidatus Heimdallarchaeota archaeon]
MNTWENSYLEASKLVDNTTINSKGVLLGFNVNLDKVIELNPVSFANVLRKTEDIGNLYADHLPSKIATIKDLFVCLIHSIKEGKANEVLISSEEVAKWIENTFVISRTVIGGQAGIMANLLKAVQITPVLLSTPIASTRLLELLDPSIIVPGASYPSSSLKSGEGIDKIEQITHYVFEFSEGQYDLGNKVIKCLRSNRFIGSYDKVNSLLAFSDEFREYSESNILNFSLGVISGFHLIDTELHPSKSFSEIFKPVLHLIKKWKERNPKLIIHLELAAVNDVDLKNKIVSYLFPLVNSIGLNEQELISYLSSIDATLSNSIKFELSSVSLFRGIHAIFSRYPHLRIHLHYLNYNLILSPLISEDTILLRKNSLMISSIFAAVKAKNGLIKGRKDVTEIDYNVSKTGLEELQRLDTYLKNEFNGEESLLKKGYLITESFAIFGIPTIVIPSPKQLTGLGDTISLTSILFEMVESK